MAQRDEQHIHWGTYTEVRADFDRSIEAVERRIRESEDRIIRRIDEQQRNFERTSDQHREGNSVIDDRVRSLEQELATLRSQDLPQAIVDLRREVTVLKTTNRILGAGVGVLLTVLGLVISLHH